MRLSFLAAELSCLPSFHRQQWQIKLRCVLKLLSILASWLLHSTLSQQLVSGLQSPIWRHNQSWSHLASSGRMTAQSPNHTFKCYCSHLGSSADFVKENSVKINATHLSTAIPISNVALCGCYMLMYLMPLVIWPSIFMYWCRDTAQVYLVCKTSVRG